MRTLAVRKSLLGSTQDFQIFVFFQFFRYCTFVIQHQPFNASASRISSVITRLSIELES